MEDTKPICGRCGCADVVGPFTMDGNVGGEYRIDARWIVCRSCNRSTFCGFEIDLTDLSTTVFDITSIS